MALRRNIWFHAFSVEDVRLGEVANVESDSLFGPVVVDFEVEPIGVAFGVDVESHVEVVLFIGDELRDEI